CGAAGALGRRAGRRRRPGHPHRARVPEPGLRGEVRLPLCGLRERPAEGRDPPASARPARADARGGAGEVARRARRDRPQPLGDVVDPYANEWLSFLARWLHVMAGIVWIGTSFYFVALDNHLRENESGESDGGVFYRVEKFMPAPPRLPDVLHWFKWEAYTTWLSGFALLVFLYYFNATTYLVRPGGPVGTGWSIAISIVLLGVAWGVYDAVRR